MPRPKPPPTRKASGENIEEWQRHAKLVQFRLTAAETQTLEERARAEGLTPNAYAQRVLRRDLMIV